VGTRFIVQSLPPYFLSAVFAAEWRGFGPVPDISSFNIIVDVVEFIDFASSIFCQNEITVFVQQIAERFAILDSSP
jgi:hypothetical protein